MPWTIRMVTEPTMEVGPDGKNGFQRLQVGDCYEVRDPEDVHPKRMPYLLAEKHAGKVPLILVLPCGTRFAVYGPTVRGGQPVHGTGWTVTGEAPLLTLTPSVDIGGGWHGHINAGVIGDDVEGRTF